MTIIDYFANTPTITIETVTGDGRPVTTPIWGVVADGACYIRSGYGDTAWWYRRLRRTWRAAVIGHGQRYRVRVEPVTDDDTRKWVDDAYRVKYRGQGVALRQAVSSPARDYTLRVVPEEEPAVADNQPAIVRRVSTTTPGSESITLWKPCISQ
jgi:hypothetical protein